MLRAAGISQPPRHLAGRVGAGGWSVTASIDAVAFLQPPASEDDALADGLIYAAKMAGRNRMLCNKFLTPPRILASAYADAQLTDAVAS